MSNLAIYKFSDQKLATLVFALFLALDLSLIGQYLVFGNLIFLGSRIWEVPQPFQWIFFLVALALGNLYSTLTFLFPSKMEFYSDYIRFRKSRSRNREEIPYSNVFAVKTYVKKSLGREGQGVEFRVKGEKGVLKIPGGPSSHFLEWFVSRTSKE
jgi:hypothetical protein